MAALSDGAIVGSAIIKLVAEHGTGAPAHIGAYVRAIKQALITGNQKLHIYNRAPSRQNKRNRKRPRKEK